MKTIVIKTQEELDALPISLKEDTVIEIRAQDTIVIRVAWENSRVVAWENSRVEAWENSRVEARENSRVVAWENSHVVAWENSRVEAWENSRVEAWGNSHVVARENSRVVARENSHVVAWENSRVEAWGNSHVDCFLCSLLIVYSVSVKIKSLLDNSRLIYKTSNCNRPEKQDPTAIVTEYEDLITPTFAQWLDRGYVVADGIYQTLVSQKTIGEVTIYETDEGFVARKGDKFAHGKTIEEAKNDLRYKLSNRDTSKYESWKLDDVKPTDELIESYMAITGACGFGTKQFCVSIKLKESYTVGEIVELTSGEYGNEQYREFFSTTN